MKLFLFSFALLIGVSVNFSILKHFNLLTIRFNFQLSSQLDEDISMDDICELFVNVHTKIMEAQKSLETFGNHFHINQSLAYTINQTRPYANTSKSISIVRTIQRFDKQTTFYLHFFDKNLKPISEFIALLKNSDIKPDDRQEIFEEMQIELQMLIENIDRIDNITASDEIKQLIKERRIIVANVHLLGFYLQRYKNDEIQKKMWSIKFIDLMYEIAEEVDKQFVDDDWPIVLMNVLSHEMNSHFNDFVVILKYVAKMLIPRALEMNLVLV